MTVRYGANNDNDEAAKIARSCDVAIVCVGNHPTGGYHFVVENGKIQMLVGSSSADIKLNKTIDVIQ